MLECGHIYNETILEAYNELGKRFPKLQMRRLGGLTPATSVEKQLALAAADIFCSPADNLQETFGLSVLEAMASGLPVVASDWNGYRDLVVDGSTGWLVPCRDVLKDQKQTTREDQQFALGLKDYDSTVGLHSLGMVVDHHALTAALDQLLGSPEQCHKMGIAGAKRIETVFQLKHICRQYRELWMELNQRRHNDSNKDNKQLWPMPTHARLFSNHAKEGSWKGPWEINSQCTDPTLLNDIMQVCFYEQIIGKNTLKKLAMALNKEREGYKNKKLEAKELETIYRDIGITEDYFKRTTSLLEKIAIIIPITKKQ